MREQKKKKKRKGEITNRQACFQKNFSSILQKVWDQTVWKFIFLDGLSQPVHKNFRRFVQNHLEM